MSNYFIHDSNLKATNFYIIFNKKYNVYKFGITSKIMSDRINWYKKQFCITDDMIKILLYKNLKNAYEVEKNVKNLVKDSLWNYFSEWGVLYKYKEHFTGYHNYVKIIQYLKDYERPNRRTDHP